MDDTINLQADLEAFRELVNRNPLVSKIIKGWGRSILIQSKDTGEAYLLIVGQGKLLSVGRAQSDAPCDIRVRASKDTLHRMFTGRAKSAELYLHGAVEVYGSPKDQLKLDGIATLLWG